MAHTDAVRHQPTHSELNEERQRERYGGFNLGAAFFGWLVAIAIGVLLTAVVAAAGSAIALTDNASAVDLTNNASTIGLLGGLAVLIIGAVSYYAGGYVAGRMSRFDGGRQGFGVWLMSILAAVVLAAAGAIFGAKYNILQSLNVPHIPVKEGTLTAGGSLTLLLSLIVTAFAAVSGGKVGEHYHRKVDRSGLTRV